MVDWWHLCFEDSDMLLDAMEEMWQKDEDKSIFAIIDSNYSMAGKIINMNRIMIQFLNDKYNE